MISPTNKYCNVDVEFLEVLVPVHACKVLRTQKKVILTRIKSNIDFDDVLIALQ